MSNRFALYCCENSAALAVESVRDSELLSDVDFITLPCSGRIETALLLKTLERGYSKIAVLGCPEDNCKYVSGNKHAQNRVDEVRTILAGAGLDATSVAMEFVSSVDAHKVVDIVNAMTKPKEVEAEQEGVST